MATRKADKVAPKPNELRIAAKEGETDAERLAGLAADGVASLAMLTHSYSGALLPDSDFTAMFVALQAQTKAVQAGDLRPAEALLMAQASTLNAVFAELLRRSGMNLGAHLGAAETYMRLALKAQGQCRATLETLATIKNPPVVFARQANIAHGPQQVNNGSPTHAEKNQTPPIQLLEEQTYVGMDTREAPAPARSDPAMEAVGAIERPHQPRGKSRSVT